jgi:prephenate dehydrogenase
MASTRVTIVGMGAIGCSIGLGLQAAEANVELIGHDSDPGAARRAIKAGAVPKTHWNLLSACDEADLIVLSLPLSAVEKTLEVIGPELRVDCVVMDTTTVKAPVIEWAEAHLPETAHFVGTNPIVASDGVGVDAAKSDLFQDAVWSICSSTRTPSEALQLVTDIVAALGASPYFVDAGEHDGLLAASDHLPLVVASALLRTIAESKMLDQMAKLGGPQLARVTSPVMMDAEMAREICLTNKENLVRWLATMRSALDVAGQVIAEGDPDELDAFFKQAQDTWGTWLKGEQGESPLDRRDLMPSWRTTLFGRLPNLDLSRRRE